MRSNWFRVQQNSIHQPDRLLDRGDWSFKGRAHRQSIPRVEHDPNQALRLQVRLMEAAVARKEWDANRAAIAKEAERQRILEQISFIKSRLATI